MLGKGTKLATTPLAFSGPAPLLFCYSVGCWGGEEERIPDGTPTCSVLYLVAGMGDGYGDHFPLLQKGIL